MHFLLAHGFHKKSHNFTISDWVDVFIRRNEFSETLSPLEKQLDIANTLAGLERMAYVGVTEFYEQSICALRSLLHNRAMCHCFEMPFTVHNDHKNNASAISLDGPTRLKYMTTHIFDTRKNGAESESRANDRTH